MAQDDGVLRLQEGADLAEMGGKEGMFLEILVLVGQNKTLATLSMKGILK